MLECIDKLHWCFPFGGFKLSTDTNGITDLETKNVQINWRAKNLKPEDYKKYFEQFISIETFDDALDFMNNYGFLIRPDALNHPKSQPRLPKLSQLFRCHNNIKEIIDLIAIVESNDRKELEKRFVWGLRETTYYPIHKTIKFVKLHKSLTLPNSFEINDYKAASQFVINKIASFNLTRPLKISLDNVGNNFQYRFYPANTYAFIWLYFTETLIRGDKYKICEVCSKIFHVEVKPGREPVFCSGTCRSRKSRRKPNERSY